MKIYLNVKPLCYFISVILEIIWWKISSSGIWRNFQAYHNPSTLFTHFNSPLSWCYSPLSYHFLFLMKLESQISPNTHCHFLDIDASLHLGIVSLHLLYCGNDAVILQRQFRINSHIILLQSSIVLVNL